MSNLKQSKNLRKINNEAGFAVLFAVLLASFLITLGISIFSISLKEIQITTSSRDSQIAYYVADSARECALYWDIKRSAFPTCLNSSCSITNPTNINEIKPIECNGNIVNLSISHPTNSTYISNALNFFQVSTTSSSSPVADLTLKKVFSSDRIITTVEARGHNTSIIGRRVERGIQTINN